MIFPALLAVATVASAGPPLPEMPDRTWDFVHLELDIEVDPTTRGIAGKATHTIAPLQPNALWVRFHQIGLDILEVRVDGAPVRGWHAGAEDLLVPVPPGDGPRRVEVTYTGEPEFGLHYRGDGPDSSVELWSQGEDEDNRHWFPGWDYPNDRFTVQLNITTPTPYTALGIGALEQRVSVDEQRTRWSYRLDFPIPNYLIAFAVGDYKRHLVAGDVPFEFYTPNAGPPIDVDPIQRTTQDAVAWLEDRLGVSYPFPVYRQVVAQRFLYEAMENPGLVLIDADLWVEQDEGGPLWEDIVVHEAAHQWFGNLLSPYGWRNLWLNEGFAEYFSTEWLATHRHPDERWWRLRGARSASLEDDTALAPRGVWTAPNAPPYGDVYGRGLMTLHALRAIVGAEAFDAAVRTWVRSNHGALVDTDAFRRVLEDHSGIHLAWFFDAFVHQGGHPKLAVESAWSDGAFELHVQRTRGDHTFPLDIEIGLETGVQRHRLWISDTALRWSLPLSAPPLWVAIDPDCAAIAAIEHRQPASAWRRQLESSPSTCARWDALEKLGEPEADEASIQQLSFIARHQARGTPFRQAAIQALGRVGEPASAALWTIVEQSEVPERVDALRAAGRLVPDPMRKDRVRALARRDPSPFVRAAALDALAAFDRVEGARMASKEVLRAPSAAERIAAMRVLGDFGQPLHGGRIAEKLGFQHTRPERMAAAEALVALAERYPDNTELQALANTSVWGLVTESDAQMQLHGLELLPRVGGPDDIEPLMTRMREHRVPALRQAAEDAAAAITAPSE